MLPTIRAALSYELYTKHRLRKSQIAKVLDVSPASISQYLKNARGTKFLRELRRDPDFTRVVSSYAENLFNRYRLGIPIDSSRELSGLAVEIMRLLTGETVKEKKKLELEGELMDVVMRRIKLEELAAKKALDIASKTNDEVVRSVLRQIASDSLRHAEILTLISRGPGAPQVATESRIDARLIEELEKYESEAEEKGLGELMRLFDDPAVLALLTSIELDERKHKTMLEVMRQGGTGLGRA